MKFALSTITLLASAMLTSAAPAPPGVTKSHDKDPTTGDKSHTTTYTAPQYNSVTKFGSVTYTALVPDCSIPVTPTLTSSSQYALIPIQLTGKYSYSYTTTTWDSGAPQLNRTSFAMRMSGYATTTTTRAKKGDKYTGGEALQLQFNYDADGGMQAGDYTESFRTINVLYNKQGLKNYFYADLDLRFDAGMVDLLFSDVRKFQCPTPQEVAQIAANPPDPVLQ
ncbi:uncharacterized protein UTRI_01918_B [Ustilago trichophora]|uniref:Uncharacterized protein n=1 Tax=Ustilago trichophora TaxID=86804 RepID=A0A5C3DXE6_9BASI|nr:uncharacterized protein UTRI_01918_B [Ustilago trichophora]